MKNNFFNLKGKTSNVTGVGEGDRKNYNPGAC